MIKPILQALVICDTHIVDQQTKKRTLVGMFNSLVSATFPCEHPSLAVFLSVTDGHGSVPCTLRLVNANTHKEVFSLPGNLNFKDPMATVELVFQINKVTFDEPGVYCLEFLADKELVGSSRLQVLPKQVKPQ